MKKLAAILSIMLLLATPISAAADGPEIIMAEPTVVVPIPINDAVIQLLTSDRPADTYIYAITYYGQLGNDEIVSVVGLIIEPPYTDWSLEDGDAIWLGSIVIPDEGDPYYFDPAQYASTISIKTASMVRPGPGGGSNIYLPFQAGKKMMYGVRGIHGSGDYGTSGMLAVDLVGSDNLGADIAPPNVYASANGLIDYVCTDGTSVTIKAYDATTTNEFVYAHLVDNANLEIGYQLIRGQNFASLTYGSFNDTCGWASQSPESYHLHWMFEPADDFYQVEGYTIDTILGEWYRGADTIRIYGYVYASGGSSDYIDDDDPTRPPVLEINPFNPDDITLRGGHIWDNMIMGLFSFVGGIADNFPYHDPALGGEGDPEPIFTDTSTNVNNMFESTISYAVRNTNLLLGGLYLISPILIMISMILFMEIVYLIYAIWRFVLKVIPAAQ